MFGLRRGSGGTLPRRRSVGTGHGFGSGAVTETVQSQAPAASGGPPALMTGPCQSHTEGAPPTGIRSQRRPGGGRSCAGKELTGGGNQTRLTRVQ